MVPPVAVRADRDTSSTVCGRCRHELAVGRIEVGESGVVREFQKISFGVRCDLDPAAACLVVLVVLRPAEEGVADAGLAGEVQMPGIFSCDETERVQHESAVGGQVL